MLEDKKQVFLTKQAFPHTKGICLIKLSYRFNDKRKLLLKFSFEYEYWTLGKTKWSA